MEPVLLLLICSGAAAAAGALGVLPLVAQRRVPAVELGWANATAAGLMLAAAFVLSEQALAIRPAAYGAGALLGILFVHWARSFFDTEDLDLNRLEQTDDTYGYQVLVAGSVHASAEGVGIGAAMAVDLSLGVFVAIVLAVHNIPEATVLGAVFRAQGASLSRAAIIGVIANVAQPLVALAAFAVLLAAPGVLPGFLGFAAGAFLYLVTVDLLPESYEQAGTTSIALGTILAIVAFAVMHGVIL